MLHGSLVSVQYFHASVQRELKELRSLHHPNIVGCLGAGHLEDGRLFLVMEYCDRGPLHDLIGSADVVMDWPVVCSTAVQIAQVCLCILSCGNTTLI